MRATSQLSRASAHSLEAVWTQFIWKPAQYVFFSSSSAATAAGLPDGIFFIPKMLILLYFERHCSGIFIYVFMANWYSL
jgi:hypothetical protein